jgi:molybdenum cofactor cytidylyltransferase
MGSAELPEGRVHVEGYDLRPGGGKAAGLVLAAGESSRMGGAVKQLLPAEGGTLLSRVLRAALQSELNTVVLVLGHKSKLVADSLDEETRQSPKLVITENPDYKKGMSTSLVAGLGAVAETHDWIMVLLGDMPKIHPGLINRVLRETVSSGGHLGAVRVKGRRSLPAVIGRRHYPELFRLEGDVGAREIFRSHSNDVHRVDVDDYDDRDIDTPDEYLRYKGELEKDRDL